MGEADEIIDATHKIVTLGLISCHAHLAGPPLDKSFIEDVGPGYFYLSGLVEMLPTMAAAQDEDSARACIDLSMAELINLTRTLQAAGERMWAQTQGVDRIGRDADGLSPKLYPALHEC